MSGLGWLALALALVSTAVTIANIVVRVRHANRWNDGWMEARDLGPVTAPLFMAVVSLAILAIGTQL